jgi:HEPN domain-containing protein
VVSRYYDWLRQAERNLKSAEINFQNELYEEVCYEAQQVAEKSVKALLSYFHKEIRGHSVTFLLQSLSISVPAEILKCAQELDKHYIPSRYPDVYDQGAPADYYNKDDAISCLECGRRILTWVKEIVGKSV